MFSPPQYVSYSYFFSKISNETEDIVLNYKTIQLNHKASPHRHRKTI